ncbi:MAG: twin-arginine translocation pathway signal protein [Acetobacteraceae bacterium]|nr:twin-arginine translocation pathway signal protein [Acetobacteraceae bacterium]
MAGGPVSRRSLMATAAAAVCSLSGGVARAQTRGAPLQLRLVAPYPPGGGIDTIARLLARPMGEFLAEQVIVENRPGAGGAVGAQVVAQAGPDGQTMLLDAMGHIVNPLLLRGLSFDYATAFVPVALVAAQPIVIVADPRLPIRSLGDLIARLRDAGGASSLTYGSSGNATGPHLAAELLLQRVGGRAVHAPYRGAAPALADVMGGSLAFALVTVGPAVTLAREGRVRALAVTSPQRVASLPGVPTAGEAGLPGFVFQDWNGLFVAAGTRPERIAQLHEAVSHALDQPQLRERIAATGAVPIGEGPSEFAAFLARERETVARIVAGAGITAQ